MGTNSSITKKDRFLGCFLGGAVGDALGYPVEFVGEAYIRACYGSQGIQTLAQAGQDQGLAVITDDTQMTLFVINGLLYGLTNDTDLGDAVWLAHREWLGTQGDTNRMEDPNHPKMWLYHEPNLHALRAPGGTCLSSIRNSKNGGTLADPVNNSKGCGAVMKAAPLGLIHKYDPTTHHGDYLTDTYKFAASLGAQTHGHPLGYLSAAYLALILAEIVHAKPGIHDTLQEAILAAWCCSSCGLPIDHELHALHTGIQTALHLALDPSVSDLDGIHKLGEGWVAEEALYIAIFCAVRYQNDFAQAIRVAVNHNGDSDSTGSICGNILGAWLGKDAVEQAFDLENLEMRDLIIEISEDLYQAAEYGIPTDDAQWISKYRHGKKVPVSEPLSPLRPVGLRYTDRTKRALQICFDAHKGQTDKSGMPYALHPIHLAEQMETEDEICTALLHDVIEDTHYTEEDLRQAGISETVLEALRLLTHHHSTPYMNYVIGTRRNPLARKVKQADLLHNSDISRPDHPSASDLRRRRKYRIALAILADDKYDSACKYYRKQIPLDDDRMYFLSIFYRIDPTKNGLVPGVILKYSLDVEKASDSHYEFGLSDDAKLQQALDAGYTGIQRSLPEALAQYFESHGEMDFVCLLAQLGIKYQQFHFD